MTGARPNRLNIGTAVCAAVLFFVSGAAVAGDANGASAPAAGAGFGKGVVSADRVNVRAAARGDAQVLGQLSFGAEVALAGPLSDPWVKIALPPSFDVWVYSQLLQKDGAGTNSICVKRVQLRAGPGLNHASLGFGLRGEKALVRGHSGDWTRLSPEGLAAYGYVTNLFVKAVPEPAKAEAPVPPPEPSPPPPPQPPTPPPAVLAKPSAPPVPSEEPEAAPSLEVDVAVEPPEKPQGAGRDVATATPSAKPRRTLLSAETPTPVGPAGIPSTRLRGDVAQARSGSYSGVLARSPTLGFHPARWRLVRFAEGGKAVPQTVCYVYGNDAQLTELSGSALVVSGAVYLYKGTPLPTVYAQDIVIEGP